MPAETPLSTIEWSDAIFSSVINDCFTTLLTRLFGSACKGLPHFNVIPSYGYDLMMRPSFLLLTPSGVEVAKRLLGLICIEHPEVVYAPGLPLLVVTCLHFMDEAATYAICRRIISPEPRGATRRRFLPLHAADMALELVLFDRLVNRFLPQLKYHLTRVLEVQVENLVFPWFETLFVRFLPFPVWIRLMDLFMLDGFLFFHRFGLAMLLILQGELLLLFTCEELWSRLSNYMRQMTLENSAGLFSIAQTIYLPSSVMEAAYTSAVEFIELLRDSKEPEDPVFQSEATSVPVAADSTPVSRANLSLQKAKLSPPVLIRPYLRPPSSIISSYHLDWMWSWLPIRLASLKPEIIFTTASHGYSLTTLLNRCSNLPRTFLIIKTSQGQIFGAFLPSSWQRSTSQKIFYGSTESFVFSFATPTPRSFSWATGTLDFFISTSDRYLCIGGDAIWLDKDLSHGVTSQCKTFASPALDGSNRPKSSFQCVALEVLALS